MITGNTICRVCVQGRANQCHRCKVEKNGWSDRQYDEYLKLCLSYPPEVAETKVSKGDVVAARA